MKEINALAAPVALPLPASTRDRPAERAPERSPSAQVTSARPAAVPAGARAVPRPAATTRDEQFRAELKLLERAVGAVRLKQLQHARQLLEQHARQFPDGLLAPNRKALVDQLRSLEGG
jgi:TolA-binding protein